MAKNCFVAEVTFKGRWIRGHYIADFVKIPKIFLDNNSCFYWQCCVLKVAYDFSYPVLVAYKKMY